MDDRNNRKAKELMLRPLPSYTCTSVLRPSCPKVSRGMLTQSWEVRKENKKKRNENEKENHKRKRNKNGRYITPSLRFSSRESYLFVSSICRILFHSAHRLSMLRR